MQKIVTFLWFDNQAEEAANFYVSLFKNSKITSVHRYGEAGPGPKGSVMMVNFELESQQFMALNGGPHFKFTPAISLFVRNFLSVAARTVAAGCKTDTDYRGRLFHLHWAS
jgi:predicted 3-demethylubiquinone-9 3-methyltransferase (glyoxalase superfamily)